MAKKKVVASPESSRGAAIIASDTETLIEKPQPVSEAERRVDMRHALVTIADKVAGHPFYWRNYKWSGADKAYPSSIDADQRLVTKCYPMAQGGQLFVDEPQSAYQAKKAYEKHEVLLKMGFRHVVIEPQDTESSAREKLAQDDAQGAAIA